MQKTCSESAKILGCATIDGMKPRPIPRFRSVLACAALVLLALNSPALRGQSDADATTTSLQVRSAQFNPATGSVLVELFNDTQKSVTAYGLDIVVTSGGKTLSHTGYGADLLDLIVNARGQKDAADSWVGAIRPGDVHSDSIAANIPPDAEVTAPVEVRVQVTVALWSDGAIEGTNQFMIRQMQDGRDATMRAEEKVLAILDAHGGGGDVSGRIGEVLNDLAQLMKTPEPGAVVPASELLNSAVLSNAVTNLAKIRESGNAAQFQAYKAAFAAQHQRRVALLQSMGEA